MMNWLMERYVRLSVRLWQSCMKPNDYKCKLQTKTHGWKLIYCRSYRDVYPCLLCLLFLLSLQASNISLNTTCKCSPFTKKWTCTSSINEWTLFRHIKVAQYTINYVLFVRTYKNFKREFKSWSFGSIVIYMDKLIDKSSRHILKIANMTKKNPMDSSINVWG